MGRSPLILGMYFFFIAGICIAQISYSFLGTEGNGDIQAYWYNVPQANVEMDTGDTLNFQSALHVYGMMPADVFKVEVHVYLKEGKQIFEKVIDIDKTKETNNVQFEDNIFKIIQAVDYRVENPEKIVVTIASDREKREKEIRCRYHRLFGRMTDFEGNAVDGDIVICPDAFAGSGLGILSDEDGYYEVILPERAYNAIIGNTSQYGVSRLESWAWHTLIVEDQKLDFKIGNGEVYNLNVWANNGGGRTYFISFRPIVLALAMKGENMPVQLNGREFQIGVYTPELEMCDIRVAINGKTAEILSLQKYYETGSPNAGCIAYIIQVNRLEEQGINGIQRVLVSYEKKYEMDGQTLVGNGMGCYQFCLNFCGLSTYF